jgi:hypothetical protein
VIWNNTVMPQIKETYVESQRKYNPFGFYSVVSLIGTIFSRNLHLLFVFSLLISDLTFVFLLIVDKLVYVHPDISMIFFRFMSENSWHICATKYQTYLEKQLNNFWTWNRYVNEISHRRFSRMDNNYISTVRGWSAWYSETYYIKTISGEIVFIRSLEVGDIRNIMCLWSSPKRFFSIGLKH